MGFLTKHRAGGAVGVLWPHRDPATRQPARLGQCSLFLVVGKFDFVLIKCSFYEILGKSPNVE